MFRGRSNYDYIETYRGDAGARGCGGGGQRRFHPGGFGVGGPGDDWATGSCVGDRWAEPANAWGGCNGPWVGRGNDEYNTGGYSGGDFVGGVRSRGRHSGDNSNNNGCSGGLHWGGQDRRCSTGDEWLDDLGRGGQEWHASRGGGGGKPGSSMPEEVMRRQGVDAAWDALEEMQSHGTTTDIYTISRMLMKTAQECRNMSHHQLARLNRGISLVYGFIELRPQDADEVLFNALLDTCFRMKNVNQLEYTLQRMRQLQIQPSHVTLGILVKAYGQAGDVSKVLAIWDEMTDQRNHANAVTFGCMIDACVKCGRMDKAIEIFGNMKSRRKHRNTILYTTLIKGYGMQKDLQHALELFREMKDEGVPYNAITYNSIIDVSIKCCDVQTAESLLRQMIEDDNGIEPDLITFSTLLKGSCQEGDLDRALQIAEIIKDRGLKCDELVYNTLLDGCVKANDLSAGIGLFAEMIAEGMTPSQITHGILVRLHQRSGYAWRSLGAVAQLYQHHGLERPSQITERGRGSRRGGEKARRGATGASGCSDHGGNRDGSGGCHQGGEGGGSGNKGATSGQSHSGHDMHRSNGAGGCSVGLDFQAARSENVEAGARAGPLGISLAATTAEPSAVVAHPAAASAAADVEAAYFGGFANVSDCLGEEAAFGTHMQEPTD
mmetsp:Transcript_39272/g.108245  ORF Transcript_39272/g.108245 Transcript_39272/m.108245 type:complete len:663 (-) Transcript_39272:197-2185(-)